MSATKLQLKTAKFEAGASQTEGPGSFPDAADNATPAAAGPVPDTHHPSHGSPSAAATSLPNSPVEPGIRGTLQARGPRKPPLRINVDKLDRAGILTPKTARYRLAEELRVIKRRLLINAAGLQEDSVNYGNLIMVTSASPGEGKTFFSANLAISIELEIDRTVLLVDCDTIRSGVSRLFGVESELGLSDLLMRPDLTLDDVIHETDIDELTLLPAGSRIPHINEQMASRKMQRLMMDLAQQNADRIIIFDSPPLLATTESSVLARLVGQIVLVVAAGQTKQDDLQAALDQVDPSKVAGVVLNKSSERTETAYYENYYRFEQKYLGF
ncbi:MAG: XrtA-associated tyrosine autokinase [Methylotetracoccus sp.]|nr:XrtA-associated tyrosine autokinase [Methylotetracoccus sp.]